MTALDPSSLGGLLALGSALTWAVTSLMVRTLTAELGSVKLNALRSGLSGLFLLAWIVGTGRAAELVDVTPATFGLLAASIVAAVAIGDTAFFESTRSLGLGRAMTVSMTYPLGAALLAALVLDEPLTPRVAAGAGLTLAGVSVIVRARGDTPAGGGSVWRGLGMASLASLAWAVSTVLLKVPLDEIDPVTAQAMRLPVAAALLALTPWASGLAGDVRAASASTLLRLLALGAVTALSAVTFVASLKYAGVAVATVLSSTAPLFALPLGRLVLREPITPAALAGAVLTVAGVVVLQA